MYVHRNRLYTIYGSMSYPTYQKEEEKLIELFNQVAYENMRIAGELEKKFARQRGETIKGIPYITVVVDGTWMKRSYGLNYDSLSGAAVIIGLRTNKVLYVGVRNKYCFICDTANRKGNEAKSHVCYKNFDRFESSTEMESDIIAAGFNASIEMYGLIYRTMIGDNDSSVLKRVLDNKPYHQYGVIVTKIECSLHLLRNMSKKLRTLAVTSQPNHANNTVCFPSKITENKCVAFT